MTKLSPSAAESRVIIGKIGAPHGVSGALKIIPITDFPDRFADMKTVYVDKDLLHIASVQVKNDGQLILMSFEEYPTRETAAQLTKKLLYVDRSEVVPLQKGQYYTFDIIGLEAFNEAGESLGLVTDVLQTGSNDVYVVSKKGDSAQLLIPALKSVVLEIEIATGRMIVRLPEEMN